MAKDSGFDWLADDDEALSDADSGVDHRPVRFWMRSGFWLILLLLTGIAVGYGLLNRRQILLEEYAEQEIIAGFELWREAVVGGDQELFNLTISADDRSWQQTQKKLLGKQLLLTRSQFGLQLQNDEMIDQVIELSPDLQDATLSYKQAYLTKPSDPSSAMKLIHTVAYHKQDDRWLQVPPDESFWGEWQEYDGQYLSVRYRLRDETVAQRIGRDLDERLSEICEQRSSSHSRGPDCSSIEPFTLVMSIDPAVLEEFSYAPAALPHGTNLIVPTPSLIGLPIDEIGYELIYQLYAMKVIDQFEAYFNLPVPLPDESIYAICFDFPSEGPRLFHYDPQVDKWNEEMPGRIFYSLRALPDDSGIVLQEATFGDDRNSLRLIQQRNGRESLLFDDTIADHSVRPIGWANSDYQPRLLLQSSAANHMLDSYGWIDVQKCANSDCNIYELAGYPSWSRDGTHSLVVDGSVIFLGDREGRIRDPIGRGFNPFWLDNTSYGFISFRDHGSSVTTEITIGGTIDNETRSLVDSEHISRDTGIGSADNVFIQYVTTIPNDPDRLLVSVSGVRDLAGEYFIFSYQSPGESEMQAGGRVQLLLHNKGTPGGTPATLTPTGFPPMDVSPDGRWLLISELASENKNSWTFILVDLLDHSVKSLSESFPILPAQFPFYDWSSDGRWLVIADQGFFRLVAPEYDYERMVPHKYDSCGFTVWSR